MGGQTMKNDETMADAIIYLTQRVAELEEKLKRLENTIHYHRKIGEADGFGYWQMG